MRQDSGILAFDTATRGLIDITSQVGERVLQSGIEDGLLTLFIRHTSASLLVQENADPEVRRDLERFLSRLVPDGDPLFEHVQEGPDDMSAHVRAALTQTHLSIPVSDSRMVLGTWQGIYLYEHRNHGHRREIAFHLVGD